MSMEEKVSENSYIGNRLCDSCIHNYLNNDEGICGCRAFPNGIPDEAKYGHNHHKILKGQVGDYVYREARYEELSSFMKYIQDKIRK